MRDVNFPEGTVRLDAVALAQLVARQLQAAQALDACAARLTGTEWAAGEHREAGVALEKRLAHLADRLTACSAGVAGLAERMTTHAQALTAADAGAD